MISDSENISWKKTLTSSVCRCGVQSSKFGAILIYFSTSIWSWSEKSCGDSEHHHIGGSGWKMRKLSLIEVSLDDSPLCYGSILPYDNTFILPNNNNNNKYFCTCSVFQGSGKSYAGKMSALTEQQLHSNREESFVCRSAHQCAKCHIPGGERDPHSHKFYGCNIWLQNNWQKTRWLSSRLGDFLPAPKAYLLPFH